MPSAAVPAKSKGRYRSVRARRLPAAAGRPDGTRPSRDSATCSRRCRSLPFTVGRQCTGRPWRDPGSNSRPAGNADMPRPMQPDATEHEEQAGGEAAARSCCTMREDTGLRLETCSILRRSPNSVLQGVCNASQTNPGFSMRSVTRAFGNLESPDECDRSVISPRRSVNRFATIAQPRPADTIRQHSSSGLADSIAEGVIGGHLQSRRRKEHMRVSGGWRPRIHRRRTGSLPASRRTRGRRPRCRLVRRLRLRPPAGRLRAAHRGHSRCPRRRT